MNGSILSVVIFLPLAGVAALAVGGRRMTDEAARWEADLVVVGSHGGGWAHRMLIGSSTERLLNLLPASLLVVPVLRPARRRPVRTRRARTGRARGPKGKVII